jgi:hypothetical protein
VKSIKDLAQVYGKMEFNRSKGRPELEYLEPNWDAWKKYMVWLPEDFVDKLDEVQDKGHKCPLVVWDDAGMWASNYRWHEEFAQRLAEYFNAIGTDVASLEFTTPNALWLLAHIRQLPDLRFGKVYKIRGAPSTGANRLLRVYSQWTSADFKKSGVKTIFVDRYNIMLPDRVFLEYNSVRREYAKIAKERLRAAIAEMRQKEGGKIVLEQLKYIQERDKAMEEEEVDVGLPNTAALLKHWSTEAL